MSIMAKAIMMALEETEAASIMTMALQKNLEMNWKAAGGRQ